MYREFLDALLKYIDALNAADASIESVDGMTPYLDRIPVKLEDELCGFLIDAVGGSWSFRPATQQEINDAR